MPICVSCKKDKRIKAREMCSACYQGKPGFLVRKVFEHSWKRELPFEERFWSYIDIKLPEECWEWTGAKSSDGYGSTSIKGVTINTHRIAWQLTYGEIPEGKHVLHHCDNPPCCNPSHLFLGDHQSNMNDRGSKGRSKGRGIRGSANYHALFQSKDIEIIKKRRANDETFQAIADDYHCSLTTIWKICNDRTYY